MKIELMKKEKGRKRRVVTQRENELSQNETQLRNLIGKFNEKFETRISDMEEQVMKFGKFTRKAEDTMTRQENSLGKQMEDLKEDVWRKMGDADVKLERKVKEVEGGLERGGFKMK